MYRAARVAALALMVPAAAWGATPRLDAAWQPMGLRADPGTVAPVSTANATVVDRDKLRFEVNFRGRSMSVPSTVMDIWYRSEKEDGWALPGERRPRIGAVVGGIELVAKGGNANGIFYFEYAKSTMEAGYWDDIESPPVYIDGEYTRPSDNLGLAVLGANYAYEAHLVKSSSTRGAFGWSLLVGGGLGVAYRTGTIDRWVANGDCDGDEGVVEPAYQVYAQGDPPCGAARFPPRVLPMVDVSAGMRFTFGERFVLRVEGGLHTMVFYGATAGLMF